MSPPDTDAVFAVLRAADPDVMDRDELAVLTGRLAQHRSWCDALQVRIARRQRHLATEGRAERLRDLLSRHGRESSKDAKAAAEREQVCAALPSFEDALAAGTVSAGHVDAITNTTATDAHPGHSWKSTPSSPPSAAATVPTGSPRSPC